MRWSTYRFVRIAPICAAVLVACSRKPKTPVDQLSYSFGVQFGKSLRGQGIDVNADMVARGIRDALAGDRLRLSEEEMHDSVARTAGEQRQAAASGADANLAKAREFLLNNKLADGIKTTASGLQYKISSPGTGPRIKATDVVVLNYRGTLIDGTEFDSSRKRGAPAEFPVAGVVRGWAEGLRLLGKGGKAILFIPPELGYADHARPPIPNHAVLIFEVEILDVKPGR